MARLTSRVIILITLRSSSVNCVICVIRLEVLMVFPIRTTMERTTSMLRARAIKVSIKVAPCCRAGL